MGFLDRFLSSGTTERSITRQAVPECTGRITAHQAWAVAAAAARTLDPGASLILITSGLDMDHGGRSDSWEFAFYLPRRNATVMLSLEPDSESADVDSAPRLMTRRIRPASAQDTQRPAFPDRFRDSPEVVAELTSRGIDFVAGPTDMKLEGRVLPSGEARWVTYYWDQEHNVPFGAE